MMKALFWLRSLKYSGHKKVTGKGSSGMISPLDTWGQQIWKRKQMKVSRLVLEHMWDARGDYSTSPETEGRLKPCSWGCAMAHPQAGKCADTQGKLWMTPGTVTVSDYQQVQICLYIKPDNSTQELSKATNPSQCVATHPGRVFPFPHSYLVDTGKLSDRPTKKWG